MYVITATELWGMVVAAFVAAGASYLWGKWKAEVELRKAFAVRKEIRALPGWQPVMMELHVSGYTYLEVAGKLQLSPEYVRRELARAYCTLRMREPDAQTEYPRKLRVKARLMHGLAKIIA